MMLSNRWNRRRYRLYAPIYDLAAKPLEQGRKRAIDRLDLESGDRILISGCGTGSDLAHLPDDVDVTAIDLTPEMINRTATRGDSLAVDIETSVGDGQNLPFVSGTFDAVLLHLVLSVVPEPEAVMAETARVLKPGGQVSIYDKFVAEGEDPSLLRRALNPLTRALFSDITRQLTPILSGTDLESGTREAFFGGIYTVTIAGRPVARPESPRCESSEPAGPVRIPPTPRTAGDHRTARER